MKENKFISGWKRHRVSILFAAPFLILFFVFMVVPITVALFLSFTQYDMYQSPKWVGLDNYLMLFLHDAIFLKALKNSLVFGIIYAPASMIICLMGAWFISDFSPKTRALLTFIFYAPSLTGGLAAIWALIFSGDSYGFLNSVLMQLNIVSSPQQWLTNPAYMWPIWIFVSLWGCMGTGFLSFVAAFRGRDVSLYEAGAMDGIKNRIQELWYITLPIMKPQLMFTALTSISGGFTASSAMFGNPSTNYTVHTLIMHMEDYKNVRLELGVASCFTVILFILMFGSNTIFKKFLNKVGQ